MAWVHSDILGQGPMEIGTVDADPTAGAGLAAAVGSVAYLNTGGGAWRKSDAANTGWTELSDVHRAAAAPTVAADDDHGFNVGSLWCDNTASPMLYYQCHDNTTGAAVWAPLSGMHTLVAIPAVTDDDANGFNVGDIAYFGAHRWVCTDNTTGTAVWVHLDTWRDVGPPTANTDSTVGVVVGSLYADQATGIGYVCDDATATAAVWRVVEAPDDGDYAINGTFRATYDFATHGGTTGTAVAFGPFLPDNCYVQHAHYEVATTFTSATDAATIAIGHADDAAGLVAAVAISAGGNVWDAGAGPVLTLCDNTLANFTTKTTQQRQLALTLAGGEDLTAGRLTVWGTFGVAE